MFESPFALCSMRDRSGKSQIPNPKSQIPTFRDVAFGIWDLGFGVWDLAQPVLHSVDDFCRVRTMRARWSFALLALTLVAATAAAQISSTSADSKAAGASLIRLDVHAMLDAMPVQDLTAADVAIIEDGAPQKVENLRHPVSPARSFVVVLDTPHMRLQWA